MTIWWCIFIAGNPEINPQLTFMSVADVTLVSYSGVLYGVTSGTATAPPVALALRCQL